MFRFSLIGYPNNSNFVKNTLLRVVFSTLFSVFGYPDETLSLVFDILLQGSIAEPWPGLWFHCRYLPETSPLIPYCSKNWLPSSWAPWSVSYTSHSIMRTLCEKYSRMIELLRTSSAEWHVQVIAWMRVELRITLPVIFENSFKIHKPLDECNF